MKHQSTLEQQMFINPLEVTSHKLCKMFSVITWELCRNTAVMFST